MLKSIQFSSFQNKTHQKPEEKLQEKSISEKMHHNMPAQEIWQLTEGYLNTSAKSVG